jgi:UDP-N-acetylmuramate: L-alanyl-gamma-D-glutamyl-meso-diaminopimelate ligase
MQFLESQGVEGHTAETNEALLEKLLANSTTASDKPQLVVFFTNGSFGGIIDRYVEAVRR